MLIFHLFVQNIVGNFKMHHLWERCIMRWDWQGSFLFKFYAFHPHIWTMESESCLRCFQRHFFENNAAQNCEGGCLPGGMGARELEWPNVLKKSHSCCSEALLLRCSACSGASQADAGGQGCMGRPSRIKAGFASGRKFHFSRLKTLK